ncbi:hypothetical protein [Leptospira sp. GIMC2001]|uniref:hypothetical protein n=1 Tax=Leptospira sp. GIMC2001 TaxID=1513297 RepID=UPI002349399E|nr:hypothetical protein [Leptospira sp. GIMC2001]WCL48120.1 hypothetical protein O4O04_12435 [Leptospira sp. GIMC2001]
MNLKILILAFILIQFHANCKSVDESKDSAEIQASIPETDILPPPVSGEEIIDEHGNVVVNHKKEHTYFQNPSTDSLEYFRVILTSDMYEVRQIRGSKFIRRKPDLGGDSLAKEEVHNFNTVNLTDEGILLVTLNGFTGGIEVINFDRRVPRINEIAKLIQSDVTRWNFLHEYKDDKPQITRMKIFYMIQLKKTLTREEILERYLKKKK